MNWISDIQKAIDFIENNLLEKITVEDVAKHIHSSADYFQRVFNIVTGISVSEYIRNRRLTLAGEELANTQTKVIDVCVKFGYESPESFTKAFTRFHGVTPVAAKLSTTQLNHFEPLLIKIFIKGGFGMNRRIIPSIPEIDYDGNETNFIINLFSAAFNISGAEVERSEVAVYSGMANRFVWIEGNWVGSRGCECLESINETPFEVELRLLKSFGWAAKYVSVRRDENGDKLNVDNEQIKRDIIETIDKGYPIPVRYNNYNRYSIIIGYEDDGKKLICKQAVDGAKDESGSGEHKPAETIVRENWLEIINEYIILKDKLEPKPERERILQLLEQITTLARRTEKIRGKISVGFAAWEAYLQMLEHEDLSVLPLLDPDNLIHSNKDSVALRLGVYCDGLCQIWERNAGLDYYRLLAERYPEWREELEAAVAALDECSKYGGFLWGQGHSFDEKGYKLFQTPEARKILADEGRKAMQKDMEAIECFERILKKEREKK